MENENDGAQAHPLIADLLKFGRTMEWTEIAEMYGFSSYKVAQQKWARWAKKNGYQTGLELGEWPQLVGQAKPPPPIIGMQEEKLFHKEETADEITTDDYSERLRTPEEMAAFHGIDLNKWFAKSIKTGYHEQGAKIKRPGKDAGHYHVTKPLHGLRIHWALKDESLKKTLASLVEQISLQTFQAKKIDVSDRLLSVEMMITDLHLGKIGFDPETMEFNWTLQDAAREMNAAIDHFLSQIDGRQVAEFLLPLGNDYLNVDNSSNQTRRGTPQMAGDFWQNVFRFGKQLAIAAIEKLATIAPVKVYMVKGNHDEDSVFSLGEVISAYFFSHENVSVTNNPVQRNYHEFGANLIGFAHGHEFNMAKAMQTMATDEPLLFGRTKFRSYHFGHLHQNKITKVMNLAIKEEHFGVDVEICPSMSPMDSWHYYNAYIGNLRRTKCFVRHFQKGLVQELYYNISEG
jgi:predicted phosphodiesterase